MKKQLTVITSKGRYLFDKEELGIGNNRSKFLYFIGKMKQELKFVKEESREFKNEVMKQVKDYQRYLQDNLVFIIGKIKE